MIDRYAHRLPDSHRQPRTSQRDCLVVNCSAPRPTNRDAGTSAPGNLKYDPSESDRYALTWIPISTPPFPQNIFSLLRENSRLSRVVASGDADILSIKTYEVMNLPYSQQYATNCPCFSRTIQVLSCTESGTDENANYTSHMHNENRHRVLLKAFIQELLCLSSGHLVKHDPDYLLSWIDHERKNRR